MMSNDAAAPGGPFDLPRLPFAESALAPFISANTLAVHHGKHHRGYVDTLNKLVAGTAYADMLLERIVRATAGRPDEVAIFNNAAQCWNHTMYWHSLRPNGGGAPPASIKPLIESCFGGVDGCLKALAAAATRHFGSGWVWLVLDNDLLKVVDTSNADVPSAHGQEPLLAIDVWEHSYYLDYQNRRSEHINAVLDKLINWSFAADNLGALGRPTQEAHAPATMGVF
jgi:Fe-Mn family superoxide dismutase